MENLNFWLDRRDLTDRPSIVSVNLTAFSVLLLLIEPQCQDANGGWELENKELQETGHRFYKAARKAFQKLQCVASSTTASLKLQQFVRSLGTLNEIIHSGIATLEWLSNGEEDSRPATIKQVYCLMHLAFAMSQADCGSACGLPESEVHHGINILRSCVFPDTIFSDDKVLFDEITAAMFEETYLLLRWIRAPRWHNAAITRDIRQLRNGTGESFNGFAQSTPAVEPPSRRSVLVYTFDLPYRLESHSPPGPSTVQELGFVRASLKFLQGEEVP
ncbi:hypothetical protein ABW19_dt0202784 [Dactylella cylindrospora]|nr:hypothetical protein ABW19_dt0202784 [Dactylella cylindrospora]